MTTIDIHKPFDRFEFEQQIMECWNVTTDIRVVSEYLMDAPLEAGREDKIANVKNCKKSRTVRPLTSVSIVR